MDNFAEHLVKKELTGGDKAKRMIILIGGIVMTVLLAGFAILMLGQGLLPFVGLVLAAVTGYGTYYIVTNMYVEYEYTFTNGELEVDKIIAKKKRRSMLEVSVGKFRDFGRYDDSAPEETDDMTVVFATSNIASEEWYADFDHEAYGDTRLVFCPDENMLENMRKNLPRALRAKLEESEE
ncbi:MAG: DUF6106 family protein [Ruminococcus sp.]|nr:DUF6106 family protein [Ruminococcus sp.]